MKIRQIVGALALLLLVNAALFAQATGRITGIVTDSTGAAVPDATVSLLLPGGTSPVLTTKSTGEGIFTMTSVRPDRYDLAIEAAGFGKAVLANIKVDTAKELAVPPVVLEVAAAAQTVEVSDSTTAVQTTSAEVAQTITQQQVDHLPVLDRQVSFLYYSQAGVTNSRTSTSINGLRPSYTNVLLDGVNIQDSVRTNSLDYMPSKLTISQVREITVSSSNSNPTIGGNANTIILTSPSGSNVTHGSAYWYNRNSALAANDWFNNQSGVKKPFLNLNQIGGSLGGHIIKDKLLYYGTYEAYRLRQQSLVNNTILTPQARQGIFRYNTPAGVQSFNVLSTSGLSIDPYVQTLLSQIPTTGNNTNVGDSLNTTGYAFNARSNETRDNVTGKVDYYLNERNAFAGSFTWNRDLVDRPDQGRFYTEVPPITNDNRSRIATVSWRSTPTATLTNEVRGGLMIAPLAFLRSTDVPAFLLSNTGISFTSPATERLPEDRRVRTYSIQDNASWVKGRHTMAFGFQTYLYKVKSTGYQGIVPTYSAGISTASQYGFTAGAIPGASSADVTRANTLLASLAGLISSASATFNATSPTSGYVANAPSVNRYSMNNYAPYFSDTWKVRRNLTLTLGLRWEYFTPVKEDNGLAITPTSTSGNPIETLLGNYTLNFVPGQLYKKDLNNWAPNVGFAWDVRGDGKTSIRGGYSISYANDNALNTIYNVLSTNAGLSFTRNVGNLTSTISNRTAIPAPPFQIPTNGQAQYALSPSSPPVLGLVAPDLATPYVQQWNLGIEHAWKGFTFEARYVANHVLKQYRQVDFNQIDPTRGGFLTDFNNARQNGLLALAATGTFNPAYNANIAGSQPLPFFANNLASGGLLTNSTVRGLILQGQPGSLAQTYQTSGFLNDPNFSFFPSSLVLYSSLLGNSGEAKYNSGQFEVRKRTANGIQLQANYTFSKSLANTLAVRGLDEQLDNRNPGIEWARSPFDLNHAFKFNHYIPLPFGPGKRWKFDNGALNRIAGGWGLGGYLVIQSGPPVSILSARGTLNRGSRSTQNTVNTTQTLDQLKDIFGLYMTGNGPSFINPKYLNPDGSGTGVNADGTAPYANQIFFNPNAGTLGTLQRRLLSGPGYNSYDFSLSKDTAITERQSIEFRADFFNIFNHPNFFVGDQNINSTTFGKITSSMSTGNGGGSRLVQFGLYYRF